VDPSPLVVIDAANTVGSVPDGWWRDRRGAAVRLRDALVPLAAAGLPARSDVPAWATAGPLELLLVTEGAARGVEPVPGVAVQDAPGSGDDHLVAVVAAARSADPGRPVLLVTADRELRARAQALGAHCAGPGAVTAGYRRG
jgi:hypothetical protein